MTEKGKGNQKLIKEHNKRLILNMIERRYATTRAALARASGLSPTTVSTLINELEREGLITELVPTPSQRGRRPVMYQVNHEAGFLVGADVGSNILTILVTDLRGSIIKEFQREIGDQVGQELVNALKNSISEAIANSGVARDKILGVGVASPGLVDHLTGTVIRANNVEWFDLPLKGILQHELGLPVHVDNMNRAAALG
ncbi:MAG: ROK family protein [Firmicutes bacterium]|nr:ROK family protein [Bacillota bacterium]